MTLSHDRIKKYVAKVTRQLEQFCARDNGKYYFQEFYRWAEQNGDFLRWSPSSSAQALPHPFRSLMCPDILSLLD
jgi:hypothetical protein